MSSNIDGVHHLRFDNQSSRLISKEDMSNNRFGVANMRKLYYKTKNEYAFINEPLGKKY